jgi:hypothetical protein
MKAECNMVVLLSLDDYKIFDSVVLPTFFVVLLCDGMDIINVLLR